MIERLKHVKILRLSTWYFASHHEWSLVLCVKKLRLGYGLLWKYKVRKSHAELQQFALVASNYSQLNSHSSASTTRLLWVLKIIN